MEIAVSASNGNKISDISERLTRIEMELKRQNEKIVSVSSIVGGVVGMGAGAVVLVASGGVIAGATILKAAGTWAAYIFGGGAGGFTTGNLTARAIVNVKYGDAKC